jgi:hypothetical protein
MPTFRGGGSRTLNSRHVYSKGTEKGRSETAARFLFRLATRYRSRTPPHAGEKLATLERWRLIVTEELNASAEGMRTQGYSAEQARTLDLIEQARRRLKAG